MAKRSDFAQKLLDDLKLRKEKLGFASSSQRSTPATSGGMFSKENLISCLSFFIMFLFHVSKKNFFFMLRHF